MRYVYGTLLILFLGLILIFAFQNRETATLKFLNWIIMMPQAGLILSSYVLGMLSGWSVLGFLRRSYRRVREHDEVR